MTRRPRRNHSPAVKAKVALSAIRGEQAKLLGFSRGSVNYSTRPVSEGDLALMRRIDELHLDFPFAGSRMLQGQVRRKGFRPGGFTSPRGGDAGQRTARMSLVWRDH